MTVYRPRIPADDAYLLRAGRAFYNFTYLEWVVVWLAAKLNGAGIQGVPKGKPSSQIADFLQGSIRRTQPPLPTDLRDELDAIQIDFRSAIKVRNRLLHANPITAQDGTQQLSGDGATWTLEALDSAAAQFEELAIRANNVLHGKLALARP